MKIHPFLRLLYFGQTRQEVNDILDYRLEISSEFGDKKSPYESARGLRFPYLYDKVILSAVPWREQLS